ncbi:MAG: MOSC N-terminal beta barrel domain-containing protein, partial [Flavobacteriales bacterium]|nr:MOSC N-terminal beta barrel domain-containing protein [Flavobacteriales bacterium]
MRISSLYVHPIKSLVSVTVQEMVTTDRGARHDRRWMLVDAQGRFITQREHPELVRFSLEVGNERMVIGHPKASTIEVPLALDKGTELRVQVWSSKVKAWQGDPAWDRWFSEALATDVRLVYMPDMSERRVNWYYAKRKALTAFTDGYPYLVIGQASLDDLNARLSTPVPMDRFRPNIVVSGGEAFAED